MRLRTLIGVVLAAPAAIAAGTLAVFLGAGILIAIAGPVRGQSPPRSHVIASPSAPTRRPAPHRNLRTRIAASHETAP